MPGMGFDQYKAAHPEAYRPANTGKDPNSPQAIHRYTGWGGWDMPHSLGDTVENRDAGGMIGPNEVKMAHINAMKQLLGQFNQGGGFGGGQQGPGGMGPPPPIHGGQMGGQSMQQAAQTATKQLAMPPSITPTTGGQDQSLAGQFGNSASNYQNTNSQAIQREAAPQIAQMDHARQSAIAQNRLGIGDLNERLRMNQMHSPYAEAIAQLIG